MPRPSPAPLQATLYTRPGCHLCDAVRSVMQPLLAEYGGTLREVNVDEQPDLKELYGYDVPVIFIGEREVARHRLTSREFRAILEETIRE
jgi:glutaredoxin